MLTELAGVAARPARLHEQLFDLALEDIQQAWPCGR
jgi:hypothetical protein